MNRQIGAFWASLDVHVTPAGTANKPIIVTSAPSKWALVLTNAASSVETSLPFTVEAASTFVH